MKEMKVKVRLVAVTLLLAAGFAFGADPVQCVWTGAMDDTFANKLNWENEQVATANDIAIIKVSGDRTLDLGDDGVTVGQFQVAKADGAPSSTKLTVTGGKLGIKVLSKDGAWKNEIPMTVNVPVGFQQWNAYNALNFLADVTFNKSVNFVDAGGTPTFYFKGDSNNKRNVTFNDSVTACDIRLSQWPGPIVTFNETVSARYIYGQDYTGSYVTFAAASNAVKISDSAYGGWWKLAVENALAETATFAFASGSGVAPSLNLCNHDQVLDRVTGVVAGKDCAIVSTDDSGNAKPATLTMKGRADAKTSALVKDQVSIRWSPTNETYQAVFTNAASTTTGKIIVDAGRFVIGGTATFQSLSAVEVAAGATFADESTAADSLKNLQTLTLGADATFTVSAPSATSGGKLLAEIAAGGKISVARDISLQTVAVRYGGSFVSNGTYSRDGANGTIAAAWVDGEGTVAVDSGTVAIWLGGNGDWETGDNWTSHAAPTTGTTDIRILEQSDADSVITVNEAMTLPGKLTVGNAGCGKATLDLRADVSVAAKFIDLQKGACLKVESGKTFYYNGQGAASDASTYPVRVRGGGEFLVAGGTAVFTNFTGRMLVEGETSLTGRVTMTDGAIKWYRGGNANYNLFLKTGGLFHADAGTFLSTDYGTQLKGNCLKCEGGRAEFAGTSVLQHAGNNECHAFYDGETVFSGTAVWKPNGEGSPCVTASAGNVGVLTFTGAATTAGSMNQLQVGTTAGGKGVFNWNSTATFSPGYRMQVADGGDGEVNVSAGKMNVGNRGMAVGMTADAVGTVNLTGGELKVAGSKLWSGDRHPNGLTIGFGATVGASNKSGRTMKGVLNMSADTLTHSSDDPMMVGAGAAEGSFTQTGGTFTDSKDLWIGAGGGLGVYSLAGGTATIGTAQWKYNLYLGGSFLSRCANGTLSSWPVLRHDADGTLKLSGGTLTVNGSTYLGCDGDGTIEVTGTAGIFKTTQDLVCSNCTVGAGTDTERKTSSTLKFVFGPDGVSTLKVDRKAVFTPGTKLVVDTSAFAGDLHKFDLVSYASKEGDIPAGDISCSDPEMKVVVGPKGIRASFPRGLVLIVR